jgi:hypothetical protein
MVEAKSYAIYRQAELVRIISDHAAPLLPSARSRFLERVSECLNGEPLGPGSVSRACRRAQAEFLATPDAPAPTVDGTR